MSSPEPSRPPWAILAPAVGPGAWGFPELMPGGGRDDRADAPIADPIEQAHELGYRTGYQAGIQQARAELAPAEDALRRLIDQLQREMALVRPRAEANLYALGLAIARWLLQREIAEDPTAVEPLIRRAVRLLPAGSAIVIQAGPADVAALSNQLGLAEADGRPLAVHWVVDPALDAGSFRLVSPERIIDGRVDVALRALYERLAGE